MNTVTASNSSLLRISAVSALSFAACTASDKSVLPTSTSGVLAVGSYSELGLLDACDGTGPIHVCNTEALVSVESVEFEPEGVVELVAHADLPVELKVRTAPIFLRALSAGTVKVSGQALFSDEALRPFEKTLTVAQPEKVRVEWGCRSEPGRKRNLVPQGGERIGVSVEFASRKQTLVGFVPDVLLGGELERIGDINGNFYLWTVPVESPAVLQVPPTLAGGVKVRFETYAARDVAVDTLTLEEGVALHAGEATRLYASIVVGSERPCQDLAFRVKTLSPLVCAGHAGAKDWGSALDSTPLVPLRTGTCQLTAAGVGSDLWRTFEIPIEVVK